MTPTLAPNVQRDLNYGRPRREGNIQVKSERYVFLSVDGTTWMICRETGKGQPTGIGMERQIAIGHDAVLRLMEQDGTPIEPRGARNRLMQIAAELALEGEHQAACAVFRKARTL
jgi:hypothetical protein